MKQKCRLKTTCDFCLLHVSGGKKLHNLRVDYGVELDFKKDDMFLKMKDPVFAVEYALQVLGSAKAVAWKRSPMGCPVFRRRTNQGEKGRDLESRLGGLGGVAMGEGLKT
ncbi:hypothetical protein L6452_08110 [Arctium lappa]|uniref:Uncharacterized protein n=1 Tax=Arctium lappa TaxID=4217 RepID=A0ACB9DGC8_ARCLA|nr:hypothetical protein L6452_08110 [Arctium lappa]